jgi:glucose/arabinose dehydrogenase
VVGLTHGIEVHAGYLYASTPSDVYRWQYPADRSKLGAPETVVSGMPVTGHNTRTLLADSAYLYVSLGSGNNLDSDSSRARVVRFPLATLSATPKQFADGELFADGLRNNVGMGLDARGRVWGVDNGVDDLARADLGGDIHEDNPADELNLFQTPAAFYGFPYCWSEFALPSAVTAGPGSQWVEANFLADGVHTDAWCRQLAIRPLAVLEPHSAPLDVQFYAGPSFPGSFLGDAFITEHGSHNRSVPTGYSVLRIPFGKDGKPRAEATPVFAGKQPGYIGYRPVSLATLPNGVLLVSNDSGNASLIALGYTPPPAE